MTPSKEDYLKAIYILKGDSQFISNKQIADHLRVSAASVTEMNTRLLEENYLQHIPYKGVKLNPSGIEIARKVIRKHRLWEVFLYECLQYQWDEVHDEAEILEHVSSDKLIDRLDQFLKYPSHDPHGGKIPKSNTLKRNNKGIPLHEMPLLSKIIIDEVADDPELLKYLSHIGIELNQEYQISHIEEFDGSMTLTNGQDNELIIGAKATEKIWVLNAKSVE